MSRQGRKRPPTTGKKKAFSPSGVKECRLPDYWKKGEKTLRRERKETIFEGRNQDEELRISCGRRRRVKEKKKKKAGISSCRVKEKKKKKGCLLQKGSTARSSLIETQGYHFLEEKGDPGLNENKYFFSQGKKETNNKPSMRKNKEEKRRNEVLGVVKGTSSFRKKRAELVP